MQVQIYAQTTRCDIIVRDYESMAVACNIRVVIHKKESERVVDSKIKINTSLGTRHDPCGNFNTFLRYRYFLKISIRFLSEIISA
jgi:hypothetical protein